MAEKTKLLTIQAFQKTVWEYYRKHGRHTLPWRQTKDPYRVLVSEVMLQQTQVDRVIPKYKAFIKKFPTVRKLASAPQSEVLALWSGLGYNRRALYLHRSAQAVGAEYKGKFPTSIDLLEKLPGVGQYTARAIAAFSYNEPSTFIETNIRSVYIHHFFPKEKKVSDALLMPLIEKSLPAGRAGEWYAALMDYGTHLKVSVGNASKRSAHYTKQSKFKGSVRQVRGYILRELIAKKRLSVTTDEKVFSKVLWEKAIAGIIKDGLACQKAKYIEII